jgi:hypothetical protein
VDKIIIEILNNYELNADELKEFESLVNAYRSIDFTDEQIKEELRSFFIGL